MTPGSPYISLERPTIQAFKIIREIKSLFKVSLHPYRYLIDRIDMYCQAKEYPTNTSPKPKDHSQEAFPSLVKDSSSLSKTRTEKTSLTKNVQGQSAQNLQTKIIISQLQLSSKMF